MGKKKLSRELKPEEVPQEANENLPEARAVRRRSPNSKSVAGGAEHRSGVQEEEESTPPGRPPTPKLPPRESKPSRGR
jgi:hypothetical protein